MRDRLIEKIKDSLNRHIGKSCLLAENIADDLLENDVIVLPCDVGDTLYDISEFLDGTSHPEIYELQGVEMLIEKNKDGKHIFTYDDCYVCADKIGVSLFFTREEAEQALSKLQASYGQVEEGDE